jgi:uncharacterized protein involved in exopolysaccharide biosynthesis
MVEEIDLRSYIAVLRRYWIWILGLALVSVVTAFLLTSFRPATYEASSVVIVTQPRYRMEFDPRFATAQNWKPAYDAYPTLATSDDVLQSVVESYTPVAEVVRSTWGLPALRAMVEAHTGGDASLLILRLRSPSPLDAAGIANAWASTVVDAGHKLFGDGFQDVAFFQEQLSQAAGALASADAALVEFEAQNQAGIVTAELESLLQAQTDHLYAQRAIASIIQDIQGLRGQLAAKPKGEVTSYADGLTALLLQIKAFNTQVTSSEEQQIATPLELRIDSSESLTNKSAAEQVEFLDALVVTLQNKSDEIEIRLAELEPEMLALQGELQRLTAERDGLALNQQLASETYLTLARKVDEARIAAQEENGTLRVGSQAAVPESPVASGRLGKVVVAGILGLVVGIVGAFFIDFWRNGGYQEHDGTQ